MPKGKRLSTKMRRSILADLANGEPVKRIARNRGVDKGSIYPLKRAVRTQLDGVVWSEEHQADVTIRTIELAARAAARHRKVTIGDGKATVAPALLTEDAIRERIERRKVFGGLACHRDTKPKPDTKPVPKPGDLLLDALRWSIRMAFGSSHGSDYAERQFTLARSRWLQSLNEESKPAGGVRTEVPASAPAPAELGFAEKTP